MEVLPGLLAAIGPLADKEYPLLVLRQHGARLEEVERGLVVHIILRIRRKERTASLVLLRTAAASPNKEAGE